jgi:hypothetical protein
MNLIENLLSLFPPGSLFDSYGSESSPVGDLSEVCRTVVLYFRYLKSDVFLL